MRLFAIDLIQLYQFEVVEQLILRNSCELVYFTSGTDKSFYGDNTKINKIIDFFIERKIKYNTSDDLIFTDKIVNLEAFNWGVFPETIKKFRYVENLFLTLTDRSATTPIGVHQRKDIYMVLLNYFNELINDLKPTHLICFDTPHTFPSILIYELAKYYNIKIIRQEYHFLSNYSLFFDHRLFKKIPQNYLPFKMSEDVFERLPEMIKCDLITEGEYIKNYIKKGNKPIYSNNIAQRMKLIFRLNLKIATNLIQGLFPFFFPKILLHFNSLNNIKNHLFYRISLTKSLFKLVNQNKYYNKISNQPDIKVPYIFFALHMQPEKTSIPMGGDYQNQILVIQMISKMIPKDWKLYVKEHPNQFNLKKAPNSNFRSEFFYKSVQKLSNVEFISLDVSSKELINNSKIVASLTGTVGIEALKVGIPVICFGEAYYLPCNSVFQIENLEDISMAIDLFQKKSHEDVKKDFYEYLLYMHKENYIVECSNSEQKILMSSLDRNYQIDNLVKKIMELCEFSHKTSFNIR